MARNRSLREVNYKLSKNYRCLQNILDGILQQRGRASVLEVGFGEGRALLEFAWEYRRHSVAFFGIDKKQEPPVERREDLARMAEKFGVCSPEQLCELKLPEIFFYDATQMHFKDDTFDLIYSAVTIRFIEDKARFLEEVCRILKPEGIALLHFGQKNWDYPYGEALPEKHLTPYNSRFVLKYQSELIPLPLYLKLFEGECFKFEFINLPRFVLKVLKLKSGRLDLQLLFNTEYSMSMKQLPYKHKSGKIQGGYRSVYDITRENYVKLIERGLIQPNARAAQDYAVTDTSQSV